MKLGKEKKIVVEYEVNEEQANCGLLSVFVAVFCLLGALALCSGLLGMVAQWLSN